MNTNMQDDTFDPSTLADDLTEVSRIYREFLARLDEAGWDRPAKRGTKEWTLHETLAHLCALNGDGLESIQHSLRGQAYTFAGLDTRYAFNAFNRRGIEQHRDLPLKTLSAELLGILDQAARISRSLQPAQADLTLEMPIYNRPVKVVEALSIIMFHAGLNHTAQVAEPAGVPPLWEQLSPEIRHRVIGRTMRAFSLLYRPDIGGPLRTTFVFRVDGPGGGDWHLVLSPEAPNSGEGPVEHPGLVIHLSGTAVFCRMLTGRLNLPIVLVRGDMRLSGDLRLFLSMNTLLSVDARPKGGAKASQLSAANETL